jgi:hypothetical protein
VGLPFEALPSEVQAVVDGFFDTRESGLLVLGEGEDRSGLEAVQPEDVTTPILERIAIAERRLLDHLDLAVQQQHEIDTYGAEYAIQLRGEVISTLIALRELWRCVPELRS